MAGVNNHEISHEIFLHYLETLAQTIEYQEPAIVNSFLQVSTLFFQRRALYSYYNNSCFVSGGTYDFAYSSGSPIQTPDNSNQNNSNQPFDPTIGSAPALPPVEGPIISFKDVDLRLGSRFDSTKIQNTSGSYLFLNRLFIGKGGKFDWSMVGKDMENIYVNFNEYSFNTTNNILLVNNVQLFNSGKLDFHVDGVFEFRSVKHDKLSSQFPKFTSLTNTIELKNLGNNILYTGGYALSGRKFSSRSIDEKPATLTYNDGRYKFQTTSKGYTWGDSVIYSDPTAIMIFIDQDTIWHPGVSFSFWTARQKVRFQRDKGPYKNSLFHNTYHKL